MVSSHMEGLLSALTALAPRLDPGEGKVVAAAGNLEDPIEGEHGHPIYVEVDEVVGQFRAAHLLVAVSRSHGERTHQRHRHRGSRAAPPDTLPQHPGSGNPQPELLPSGRPLSGHHVDCQHLAVGYEPAHHVDGKVVGYSAVDEQMTVVGDGWHEPGHGTGSPDGVDHRSAPVDVHVGPGEVGRDPEEGATEILDMPIG